MQSIQPLKAISDDELLRRLAALLEGSPRTEAYLRIAAARASRGRPMILEMLGDGRLHLTGIALLAPHLTRESGDVLLQRATHTTKREIEELVAELAPRPDVQPSIRRLPAGRRCLRRRRVSESSREGETCRLSPPASDETDLPAARGLRPEQVDSEGLNGLFAGRLDPGPMRKRAPECQQPPASIATGDSEPRWAAAGRPRPALIEPLSPSRYQVQFTASAELRDKLERLKALMRSSVPDGDLAAIIDAAVTEKLERLEARRFGQTKAPRKELSDTDPAPSSRHVPAAVKRAVHERDHGRCRYLDEQSRRCTARVGIEFHHGHPLAMGGDHSPVNVSEVCRAHNQHLARLDFGRKGADKHRRGTARVSLAPELKLGP